MQREIKTEFDLVRKFVEDIYEVDLKSQSRKRNYVNARITFSQILYEQGYRKCDISRYLGKDHATILHYCKNFEGLILTDPTLRRTYEEVKGEYMQNYDPIYVMQKSDLKKVIFDLREKIRTLSCEIEEVRLQKEAEASETARFDSIFKMIEERTRRGSEEELERKLNKLFNGLY